MSYLRTSLPGGVLTERDGARPRQIRRIVRAQLRHWRLEELVEPAQLVVSELVTNAFQHGWGDEVGIHLSRTARTVRVEVRTSPLPTPRPVSVPTPSPVSGPASRPVLAPAPRPLPGPTATPPPPPTSFANGQAPHVNGEPRPVPAAPRPAAGRARPVVATPRTAPGAPPPGPPAPRDVPAPARATPPAAGREAFGRTAPFLPRDPLAERGRGLFLVEALADDWGIRGDGAVVWCTLSSPDGPDALEGAGRR
ncbi:ATP-binding protein [Streptomyces sp. NPDC127068]|uniref:ATP-binding protein n=1 Tax=Streptomyces sp. NPDC127068 TaxID=3347127 RepID=UPI0036588135